MPLPAVSDAELLAELRILITAGSRLPTLSAREPQLPSLLAFARASPSETFGTTARRLLEYVDRAFRSAERDPDESPIDAEDRSAGLRILFGTHPDYADQPVMVRRVSAAECLLPRSRSASLKADSIYRTHEARWAQLALRCLLSAYGRADGPPRLTYESIERSTSAVVGEHRFIQSVTVHSLARSCVDALTSFRLYVNAYYNRIMRIEVVPLYGVEVPDVVEESAGRFRITLPLREPLSAGETVRWGFMRRYYYDSDATPASADRHEVVNKNGGFTADITVRFDCEVPDLCWKYDKSPLQRAIEPTEGAIVMPDATRTIRFHTGSTTEARWGYGLAWRWDGSRS